MSIRDILHDSEYDLDVFPNEYVIDLEHKIVERQTAKRVDAYLLCAVRNKLRACLKTIVNRSEFSESNYNSRHHEHFVG